MTTIIVRPSPKKPAKKRKAAKKKSAPRKKAAPKRKAVKRVAAPKKKRAKMSSRPKSAPFLAVAKKLKGEGFSAKRANAIAAQRERASYAARGAKAPK
jgi:hypothetical protein